MPLPINHPWTNQSPVNDAGFYLYAIMGASNTIGSMALDELTDPKQQQFNNTLYEKKVSHIDTLTEFSNPVNNSNTSNYNLLNEDGAYGYAARLSARLREHTRKTVCIVSGGESATPLTVGAGWYHSRNNSNPFDMTTRYGQMVNRLQNAENLTGSACQFMVTNMAGRDAALNVQASYWFDQYEAMVNDIRNDICNPNLVFVNIGLGPTPVANASNYPAWDSIRAQQDNLETLNNVYNINPVIDLGYSLASHIQGDEVHYNTDGYNGIADAIIDKLFG